MKISLTIAALTLLTGCNFTNMKTQSDPKAHVFYVGTYTGPQCQGIYKFLMHNDGSMESLGLAAETPNPTYLAKSADKKFLLAISEVSSGDNTGSIISYRIEDDSLLYLSKSSSGGAHPCFVAANKSGYVLAANYTGGNIGLFSLDKDGILSDLLDLQQHSGQGIHNRQQGPHAHSAWFDPKNENVLAVDLGTNEIWISHLDKTAKKLIPAEPSKLEMEDGAGPRHLCFHPNGKWIYVVNELNCTVSLVKRTKDQNYQLTSSVTTLPDDFQEENTCADIHISSDGKFVYASNRGHNSIAIFSVSAQDGALTALGYEPTRGSTPRNFSLSPNEDYLLVANQNSGNIVSFKRDSESGLLEMVSEIQAPTPVCILF